jgi:magnesium chelatase family protein
MDRIDLQVTVARLKPDEMTRSSDGEPSSAVKDRVQVSRQLQQSRFQNEARVNCNAQMQSRHLRQWCKLDAPSRDLLEAAIKRLGLSARATDRILKVARTIADLASTEHIQVVHVAEAVQYRTLDRVI